MLFPKEARPTMTFPSQILALSITSDFLILAITVESTIIVLTRSPTSAVSPPVLKIFTPYCLYSLISFSVPFIIEEITSPEINFLFLPMVEEYIMLLVAPTHIRSSIFITMAS